jgi:arylsulfatase A-like enzyme
MMTRVLLLVLLVAVAPDRDSLPNVVLLMADDQGWGDTGYNGHAILKTPHLDAMSREGIRFDRWYAAAPVCSPTRGSCLTGRHPYRYGVFTANAGHMKKEEVTLAEALKAKGYATGHFGKWHLGTLSRTAKDGRRGGKGDAHYAPPWEHGFDVCFSTEVQMPTWDPMKDQSVSPTRYWEAEGKAAMANLEGDDARVIMDRALPFIRDAARRQAPFLAVVWFHTPHEPVRGGGKYLEMYEGHAAKAYYACITAMDEQVGRLRKELAELGVAGNTMVWYSSDNGPEHKDGPGSAGPFRGRKRSLYEGGVRVPGLLAWPDRIRQPRVATMPCVTSDYLPTILELAGAEPRGPIDGVSLVPLIEGRMTERPRPIGFESDSQLALTENRFKLYSSDKGKSFELYDLVADPGEMDDLARAKRDEVARLSTALEEWRASCRASREGKDYR